MSVMIGWVEENCSISLKELCGKLLQEFQVTVCPSTVGNYLEGQLFTLKNVHREPLTMNSGANKMKRAEYVTTLNNHIPNGKQIVYIDETNFNLFCRKTRGRARSGCRAVQILPSSRGPNVHLIGAIFTGGVLQMDRRRGNFRNEDANTWLASLAQKWQDLGHNLGELVVVCDNAPCHSRLESAFESFGINRPVLLRLSPYSPMLNPIENIWSKIKNGVKERLNIPFTMGPGVIEQRLVYLENIIDQAKNEITPSDCGRAIQHSTTHHPDALAMVDMAVGM